MFDSAKILSVLSAVLIFVTFFAFSSKKIHDSDFGSHLSLGKRILEERSLPENETFSYWAQAEGKKNKIVSWLSFVVFYQIASLLGPTGLSVIRSLLFALCGCLVLFAFINRKPFLFAKKTDYYLTFLTAGLFFLAGFQFRMFVRAEMFSFTLLALFVLLSPKAFKDENWNNRYFYTLVFLQCLWTNLHLSFVLGLAYSGLFLLDKRVFRGFQGGLPTLRGFVPLLLLFGVTFVNPNTFYVYDYFFHLASGKETSNILEWMPFFEAVSLGSVKAIGIYLGVLAVLCLFYQRRYAQALILVFFIYLGVKAIRNFPFYTMIAAPLLGPAFYRTLIQIKSLSKNNRLLLYRLGCGICSALFCYDVYTHVDKREYGFGMNESEYPFGAVRFIREHGLQGRMFNDFSFGAFLTWKLYPDYQVFIDGRTQVYGADLINLYRQLPAYPHRWRSLVEKYDIQFAVASCPELYKGQLVNSTRALFPKEEWGVVYFDELAIILVRKDGPNHGLRDYYHYVDPFFCLFPQHLDGYLKERWADEVRDELLRNLKEAPENHQTEYLLAYVYARAYPSTGTDKILEHLKNIQRKKGVYLRVHELIDHYERRGTP